MGGYTDDCHDRLCAATCAHALSRFRFGFGFGFGFALNIWEEEGIIVD